MSAKFPGGGEGMTIWPAVYNWMSLFSVKGVSGVLFHFYFIFERNSFNKQKVQALIRRRVLRRLIWVYTVCQCPIMGRYAHMGWPQLITIDPDFQETVLVLIISRKC